MSIFDVIEEELRLRSIDLQNVFHNTNEVCKKKLNLQHKFEKTNHWICEINLRISMVEIKSSANRSLEYLRSPSKIYRSIWCKSKIRTNCLCYEILKQFQFPNKSEFERKKVAHACVMRTEQIYLYCLQRYVELYMTSFSCDLIGDWIKL